MVAISKGSELLTVDDAGMCQRDGVKASRARSHLLPMDRKAAFQTYIFGSFGLSKVRYAPIGVEVPRPIIKHGATKQEVGQKKRRPIHCGPGAWMLSGLQVVKS